jgi:hypothetical protein
MVWRTISVVIVWFGCVVVGSTVFVDYGAKATLTSPPKPLWPGGYALVRSESANTLTMFLHPNCPCSVASLEVLDQIVSRANRPVVAYVVFFAEGMGEQAVRESELWDLCAKKHRLIPRIDTRGELAQAFDVSVSGQTFLYNAGGEVTFSGGLTASRGQLEYSLGADAVVACLQGEPQTSSTARTFGCALYAPEKRPK